MTRYLALLAGAALLFSSCGPKAVKNDNPAYHNPATQALTDSIEADPGNAGYYFNRAEALANMDLDSLALEDVKAAQKLDSKNPRYNFTIGYLLLKRNQPEAATKALLRNLEESPGNVNVRLLLSRAYLASKNAAAAQDQISKILAAAPKHTAALMIQAQIKAAQQDTTAAIGILKTLQAADPRNYDATFQLADWYKASGNPEAITQYEAAFRIDTTDAAPLFEIGDYYEKQQQPQKAKAAYRLCLSNDRDYTDAYLQLGKILLAEDSTEKALRHFNMAINVMPNSAAAYYNKGLCFEKLHQKDSAVAAYNQSLVFDKTQQEAVAGLKRLRK